MEPSSVSHVFRLGSATDDALTPRAKDTQAQPGVAPGLSVEVTMPREGKAQRIDLALLASTGLAFLPDDLAVGGQAAHGVIAPVGADGKVDGRLLAEWASTRGTGQPHRLTISLRNAIVERDVRSAE